MSVATQPRRLRVRSAQWQAAGWAPWPSWQAGCSCWRGSYDPGRYRAAPPAAQAGFDVKSLYPTYEPTIHDYVVRCNERPRHGRRPRIAGCGRRQFRAARPKAATTPSSSRYAPGEEFVGPFGRTEARGSIATTSAACRTTSQATPSLKSGTVSPQFFTADDAFAPLSPRYAMIFDSDGVPIWWYRLAVEGPRVLSDGNILWFRSNGQASRFEIRHLDGALVRRSPHRRWSAGRRPRPPAAASGGYLDRRPLPADRRRHEPIRGPINANVLNAELQEVGPQGQLLWDWESQDHIAR